MDLHAGTGVMSRQVMSEVVQTWSAEHPIHPGPSDTERQDMGLAADIS